MEEVLIVYLQRILVLTAVENARSGVHRFMFRYNLVLDFSPNDIKLNSINLSWCGVKYK
jgi:hypothetical protein